MSDGTEENEQFHVTADLDSASLGEDDWAGVERLTMELMKSGATLSVARGITEEEMENAYSVAYHFIQQEKFADAKTLFRFLCLYGSMEVKHWMGLAISLQALGEYEEAIKAYAMVCFFKMDNPVPYFHTAQCHIKNNNYKLAESALDAVSKLTEGKAKEFRHLIELSRILSNEIARESEKDQPPHPVT